MRQSGADGRTFARLRYTPGTSPASRRVETSAGVRQLEPGDQPPAAPSPPAPPRREARDELKPPAAFRVAARRTQLRRPRPGSVGDLDPDGAASGDDRDRDRLPGSTRPAVPDTVAEDLADQQDSNVPARVPGAEYLSDECAGGTRPLRPPGKAGFGTAVVRYASVGAGFRGRAVRRPWQNRPRTGADRPTDGHGPAHGRRRKRPRTGLVGAVCRPLPPGFPL
jgi:hypothetical protein